MAEDVRQNEEANQKREQELKQQFEGNTEVSEFVRRSIEGVWCRYFRERTNEWVSALYSLVEGATYFILLTGELLEVTELVVPVVSFHAVGSLETHAPAVFPQNIMTVLPASDADRLVMATYDKAGQLTRFCILEESALLRSNFVCGIAAISSCMAGAQENDKPQALEDVLSPDEGENGVQLQELPASEDVDLISIAPSDPGMAQAHVISNSDFSKYDPGHEENLITAVWLDWRALQTCAERGDPIDQVVLRNREVVLRAVRDSCGEAFQFAAIELRSQRDVVLEVMKSNGLAFQWAAPELRGDRAFVMEVVSTDGRALKYATPDLRADRGIVLTAVRQHGPSLAYASEDLLSDFSLLLEATEKEMSYSYAAAQQRRESERIAKARNDALKEAEFRPNIPLAVQKVRVKILGDAVKSGYDDLMQSFQSLAVDLKDMEGELEQKRRQFAHLGWF